MNSEFRLHPVQASAAAASVDAVYFYLVAVATFFSVLIFILIVYLALKYRATRTVDRTNPVHENLTIELAWSAVPLVLAMTMFGWGAAIFVQGSQAPPNARVIDVIGKQWMWRTYQPEGKQEINRLHVPVGTPIRLRMISDDVIHSFFIPAFRVKQDVLPGRHTHMTFTATRPGEYHLFCAEYCGTEHAAMRGTVVVLEPGEFAEWLRGTTDEAPETAGARLFEQYRCHNCHHGEPGARGPSLAGLLGRTEKLQDGSEVQADVEYVRDSIINPAQDLVAGYPNIMPLYRGQLTEQDVLYLIAYIRTLRAPQAAAKNPE
jgi:cytochrome c oxidase subunit 2